LNRAEKREQLTKKNRLQLKKPKKREDEIQDNPLLSERQKILDEKSHKRFLLRRKLKERKEYEEERRQNDF
jgi:hypothetical protein